MTAPTSAAPGSAPKPPPDLRLFLAACASWLGAVAGSVASPAISWIVAASLLLLCLPRRLPRSVAIPLVLLATALTVAAVGRHSRTSGPLAQLASRGGVATAVVAVTADPQLLPQQQPHAPPSVLVAARLQSVLAAGGRWTTRLPVLIIAPARSWRSVVPSTRVRLVAKLQRPRGTDTAALLITRQPPRLVRGPNLLQRWAERFRGGLRSAAAGLPDGERGLLPGLAIGDTSAMPASATADFRAAGLTHLTAVSGANLAIVVSAVFWLLGWLRAGIRLRVVVTAVLLLGFVVVARPTPSVVRAGAMGLLALAAVALGRPKSLVPALLGTVIALSLFDPLLVTRPGFALSVLATFALLVLAPGWGERLRGWLPRALSAAGPLLAVPLAAQAACAPTVATMSGTLSIASLPANVLAVPAIPVATLLGLAAAVVSLVSPPVAAGLCTVAGLPCSWLIAVARAGARLPLGSFPAPQGISGFGAVLAVVLATRVALGTRGGRRTISLMFVILAIAAAAGRR